MQPEVAVAMTALQPNCVHEKTNFGDDNIFCVAGQARLHISAA